LPNIREPRKLATSLDLAGNASSLHHVKMLFYMITSNINERSTIIMKCLTTILRKPLYVLAFFVLVAAFICANTVKADIVADGLVAYWSLDASTIKGDTVKDIVGGNDGVIKGKVVQVAGKINGALQFNGDSSVDVEGTKALNFNTK